MTPIDISVVIPTFRREQQLLEAIGSVLAQQGITLEVIVVDDSPDGSARSAVESVTDPRVQYMQRAEPSRGRPALVRNDGARAAKGRYLYFLDDDDMLEPGALVALSSALDGNPQAGMAFGVIVPFGPDELELQQQRQYFARARRKAARLRGARGLSASLLFCPSVLVNSACMARRDVFVAVGGFDAEIAFCEDADFWARVAHASGFIFLDRPVVRYRTGAPSMMHSLTANDERQHSSYRRIQDKYRQAHGLLQFLAMKIWARALLR
jgi:GT2 family glycosyltransferase